jgi:hypothetical protein
MAETDIARLLDRGRWPAILGEGVVLLFPAPPRPEAAIDRLGGLVLDGEDQVGLASAKRELLALDDSGRLSRDRIVGFIPAGPAYAWILAPAVGALDLDLRLVGLAARRLGARPAGALRVVLGTGATHDAEKATLAFGDQMLQSQPGVLVSYFQLFLDAAGLQSLLESGRGPLIS